MTEKSKGQSRRERIRQKQKKDQNSSRLVMGVVALGIVAFMAFLVQNINSTESENADRDAVGQEVAIMDSSDHVPDNTVVEYITNPPSSGPHSGSPLPAGFYEEDSAEANTANIEGRIVHSLEHGYVVIWYNCSILSAEQCLVLKDQIKRVMVEAGPNKVIAMPWLTINEQVVLTSWGQMLRLNILDFNSAVEFVSINRSHPRAPEPNVP